MNDHVRAGAPRRTARRTPRRPSSIQAWSAPVRNHDWVAARIGLA
jgi:hypothetical protein